MPNTFTPEIAPVGPLWLSAILGLLPLATIFLTLGVLRWRAHFAGLAGVLVALAVAILFWKMPVNLALGSGVEGFVFGVFPIAWIVLTAVFLYQLTVASGRFEDLRGVFDLISDDPRVQAVVIAFSFGALLEALAGFGAPVAITGVMLMAIGFSALRAACVVLIANTAPVAFGAIAIPILTAGKLTGIPYQEIGAYVGHQTPVLAVFVPFILLLLTDGRRGVGQVWPVALVGGLSFSLAQWASATWFSTELTDIVAALVSLLCIVALLRFWQPAGADEARARLRTEHETELASMTEEQRAALPPIPERVTQTLSRTRITMAVMPYLVVVIVFGLAKLVPPIKKFLASTDIKIHWPGLDGRVLTAAGTPNTATIFSFTWLSNPGTLLLITAVIVALIYRIRPALVAKEFTDTFWKMRYSFLTIGFVLALAYVMNLSGQTTSIGTWLAGAGTAFAFISPILGWIGVAVTGSDTSANALFATLQQAAATQAGIDPTLVVAGNSSGGVVGKMISPQNLTIAATAVGLLGREADILRRVVWWSLGMLVFMCLLVGLQATPVLSWMLP